MACRSCRSGRPNISDSPNRKNVLPPKAPVYFVNDQNFGPDLNAARQASVEQQAPVVQKWE